MKKFIVISIVLLMLAGFAITSSADSVTLWAGQDINVGNLTVVVEGEDLVVTYNIDPEDPEEGWELLETHLYVGYTNPEEYLTSAPGQFPYSEEHDPAVFTVTYTISISDIDSYKLKGGKKWVVDDEGVPGIVIYIAAHAEVRMQTGVDFEGNPVYQEETAWADGEEIRPDKNWAMYFEIEIPEPEPED